MGESDIDIWIKVFSFRGNDVLKTKDAEIETFHNWKRENES